MGRYGNSKLFFYGQVNIDIRKYGSVYGPPESCDYVYMVELFYVDMSRYNTS